MKAAWIVAISLILGIVLVVGVIGEDVPQLINYQGILIKDGKPYDGEISIKFSIYADSTADARLLWSEVQPDVMVSQGHYNVLLGIVNHFEDGDSVFLGAERYLGIKVGNEPEMTPRIRIVSVGFALNADKVDGQDASKFLSATYLNHLDASDGDPANAVYVDTAGNVGIGTMSPDTKLDIYHPGSTLGLIINRSDGTGSSFMQIANNAEYYLLGIDAGVSGSPFILSHSTEGNLVTVKDNGNVGIGTTGPVRPLEILDDIRGISFETPNTSPHAAVIRFGDHTGWKLHFGRSREGMGREPNTGTTGILMTIQDAGPVGIGTMNPSYALDVVGDIHCTGKLSSDGGNDPPYVLYNKETRESIIERVAKEVPQDKLDGAVLFWNGDDLRFEVYLPGRGEFRDLLGNLLAKVPEVSARQ